MGSNSSLWMGAAWTMTNYLLDTSVLIDWLRGREPVAGWLETEAAGGAGLMLTPISVAEVLAGIDPTRRPEAARLLVEFMFLNITFSVASRAAELYWAHERSGSRLPLPDLLQAATALEYGLSVATSNIRHFPDVVVVDPRVNPETS